MNQSEKIWVLDAVKDITIATMSNSNTTPCKESGEYASAFMEELFNKLTELVEKSITE